jgi:hypothetical protein
MFHLMQHMPEQLAFWGPVRTHWMYGLEDFFGYCMTQIKTRSNPVASIMLADRTSMVVAMAKELVMTKKPGGTETQDLF